MNDNIKDLAELFEEDEKDIYRRFDEVEADRLVLFYRRGTEESTIQYDVTLPWECTYGKFVEYFEKFLSEVYGYQIYLEAYTEPSKEDKICDGCTNTSCLKNKGCM